MNEPAATRYPGYDVLTKWDTPSWDPVTRAVIARRLALADEGPRYLSPARWQVLRALCARIIVQRADAAQVPTAALLDDWLQQNVGDGYRDARLPTFRKAWEIGLDALDAESRARHGTGFAELGEPEQIALLRLVQQGQVDGEAWQGMPPSAFFAVRVLNDIAGAYYAHPYAWSEIGFGGPANPRGYVRMDADRRDNWEAIESGPDDDPERVRKANRHVR